MPNYPPRLINISAGDSLSNLLLDDGSEITVDVSPARLESAFIAQRLPPLHELIASRTLGVYVDPLDMTAEVWEQVSRCLCRSPRTAKSLESFPTLWAALQSPFATVAQMPQRVYGGISLTALYTSWPINFHADHIRPAGWLYSLLNAPQGWLFKIWVNPESEEVDVQAGQMMGHFIE